MCNLHSYCITVWLQGFQNARCPLQKCQNQCFGFLIQLGFAIFGNAMKVCNFKPVGEVIHHLRVQPFRVAHKDFIGHQDVKFDKTRRQYFSQCFFPPLLTCGFIIKRWVIFKYLPSVPYFFNQVHLPGSSGPRVCMQMVVGSSRKWATHVTCMCHDSRSHFCYKCEVVIQSQIMNEQLS